MEELNNRVKRQEYNIDKNGKKKNNNRIKKFSKSTDFKTIKNYAIKNLENKNTKTVKTIEKINIESPQKNENKSNSLINKIKNILILETISEKEKKRIINLFSNFFEFLFDKCLDKKLVNSNKKLLSKKTNRLKLSDVNKFIEYKYKNSKVSTIVSIKIKMRKYIRILNGEPKLNYRQKIVETKDISNPLSLNQDELYLIIKHLMKKETYFKILLFYFSYFVGLNYSLISRILIKNLNSSFNKLYLKKGLKVIRHSFPPYITYLLFFYFKKSRTYNSKYFFNDYDLGKNQKTRVETIKIQLKNILEEIKNIPRNKKKYLLFQFSKLRKSKKLNNTLYILFNPEYIKLLDNKNFDNKYYKTQEKSENFFINYSVNEKLSNDNFFENSFNLENDIKDEEYFGDNEDSLKMNFDELLEKHEKNKEKFDNSFIYNNNGKDIYNYNSNEQNKETKLLISISDSLNN